MEFIDLKSTTDPEPCNPAELHSSHSGAPSNPPDFPSNETREDLRRDHREQSDPTSFIFLRKFMRDGLKVAAITPSSRYLARAHAKHVDPNRAQVIVELGSGSGAVTDALLSRMHPDSRLVAFEIDPQLARLLRKRCPRATVVERDAGEVVSVLSELGLDRIDLMVSCLALPSLPIDSTRGIFTSFDMLGHDAVFTQQTLVPILYRWMYTRMFNQVEFRGVLRNLPPGGVYHCRRLKAGYFDYIPGKA